MKILLADDSPTSRYVLQAAVERLGHECTVAEDGLQAWEAVQHLGAEVVISDWMMPGIDGEELCRRIRSAANLPYAYFIMLTALEDREPGLRGMQAGADDYLVKPLLPYELEMRLIAASRVTALHRRLRSRQRETEQETQLALGVERGLLPGAAPVVHGVSAAGRCLRAANIGGDCFDYVADAQGRFVTFIAEVAGHSISSALLMAMGASTLRREIETGASPADVLATMNREMFAELSSAELPMTIFCTRYDPTTRTLVYASAGHAPPLLRHGGEVLELDSVGAAVGSVADLTLEEHEVSMLAGDRLLLYSDGALSARDAVGENFGTARLNALLHDDPGAAPERLLDHVFAALQAHADGEPQIDDITLVALETV